LFTIKQFICRLYRRSIIESIIKNEVVENLLEDIVSRFSTEKVAGISGPHVIPFEQKDL